MAKYKYAVNLMLEFDGEKPPFKKDIKDEIEALVVDYYKAESTDYQLRMARVRSVDLD